MTQNDKNGVSADGEFERNLNRLLAHAHRPVSPSRAFELRLATTLRESQTLRARSRRAYFSVCAAAAVLLIAVTLTLTMGPSFTRSAGNAEVALASGKYYFYSAAEQSWKRVAAISLETKSLVEHDVVALGRADTARVSMTTDAEVDAEIELGSESVFEYRSDLPPRLERGTARVAGQRSHELMAAFLKVRTKNATYDIDIQQAPPALSVDKEFSMNNKIVVGGATVAAIVIVSIAVLKNSADPVDVETPNGEVVRVESGETGAFSSSGGTRVVSSGKAGGQNTASPSGASGVDTDPAAVRESITGRVVDVTGEGVAEAMLRLERADTTEGQSILGRATSDEDGNFTIEVPQGSTGAIVVSKDRYSEATSVWPPEGIAPPEGTEPAVTDPEGSAESDAPTVEHEPVVITLSAETAIAGRFFDAKSGEPLDKALIGIQRYWDQYRRDEPKVRLFESEDGSFYWGDVAPGKYRVWAYRKGYCRSGEANIEVAKNQLYDGVELSVVPGATVTGSVFSKRTGRPVAGAIVYAHLEHLPGTVNVLDREFVDERVGNATHTDEHGEYEIQDLSSGKVLVRVLHPDFMPLDHWTEVAEGGSEVADLALKEGTGFRGKVLDENNNPVTTLRVIAITMTMNPEHSTMTWAVPDENGDYYVKNLNPGPYIIVAIDIEESDPNGGKVQMGMLGATEDTVIDFIENPTLATVRGRVVDENGEPTRSMPLSFMTQQDPTDPESGGEFSFESSSTDADGYYEIKNLKLTSYSIGISPNNSGTFTIVGTIDCLEAKDYEKNLTYANLSITGTVTDTEGTPLENAEVIVMVKREGRSEFDDFAGRSMTDHEGRFTVVGLNPGAYRLFGRAQGYTMTPTESVTLDPESKRTADFEISLKTGGEVEIVVKDAAGNPAPDIVVHVVDTLGNIVNGGISMKTDGDGNYVYSSLNPGQHTVKIYRGSAVAAEKKFETKPAARVKLTFDLPEEEQQ